MTTRKDVVAEVLLLKKLTKFLVDNTDMPDDEVAAAMLEIIDEERAKKKRILVVGQILYDGQERPYTVALGPYSTAGKLDTKENWDLRSEAHAASRTEGGKLAWDTSTKTGEGRFMIVPLLRTARDAWDFFRGAPEEEICEVIEQAEAEWSIRGLPSDPDTGPPCTCGLRPESGHSVVLGVRVEQGCQRCKPDRTDSDNQPVRTDEWDLEF